MLIFLYNKKIILFKMLSFNFKKFLWDNMTVFKLKAITNHKSISLHMNITIKLIERGKAEKN